MRTWRVNENNVLISFDVASLFTNVPLDETIDFLVSQAFKDDWLNKTHDLHLQHVQLKKLLQLATKDQLFQYNGDLYEQFEGVAMGSPLGPLMANSFMVKLEHELERREVLPSIYRRYVDDTIAVFESRAQG